jgi:Helix-turn-helix domain
MSGDNVSLVFDAVADIDPRAKLVLVCLADHANKEHNGIAFPSVATLARRTGFCERTVRYYLRALEAASWISRASAGHGGRGMATRYQLNLTRMRAIEARRNAASMCSLSTRERGRKRGENPAIQNETRHLAAPELEVELESITGSRTSPLLEKGGKQPEPRIHDYDPDQAALLPYLAAKVVKRVASPPRQHVARPEERTATPQPIASTTPVATDDEIRQLREQEAKAAAHQ